MLGCTRQPVGTPAREAEAQREGRRRAPGCLFGVKMSWGLCRMLQNREASRNTPVPALPQPNPRVKTSKMPQTSQPLLGHPAHLSLLTSEPITAISKHRTPQINTISSVNSLKEPHSPPHPPKSEYLKSIIPAAENLIANVPNSNSHGIRTAHIYPRVRQGDWIQGKFEAILGYTQDLVSKQD